MRRANPPTELRRADAALFKSILGQAYGPSAEPQVRLSLGTRRINPRQTGWVLALCAVSWLLVPRAAMAASQDAVAAASTNLASPETDAQQQPAGSGQDFTRPQNLFQLRDSYRTRPGTIRPVTIDTLTLRADRWFDLAPQWQLALRADLPFVAKNPINSDDPDGHFLYGLGDADAQAALIHTFDPRWAAGLGIRTLRANRSGQPYY